MPLSKTFLPIVIVMSASFGICVPEPILNALPSCKFALPPNNTSAPEPLYDPLINDVASKPVVKLESVYKNISVVPLPLLTSA